MMRLGPTLESKSVEPLRQVTPHYYYNANRYIEYFLDQNMPQGTSRPARPEGMNVRTKERFVEVHLEEMMGLKGQWPAARLQLG